ncbi:MAG: heme NO-binding domain-containing protein [Chloroflexota bacterium]
MKGIVFTEFLEMVEDVFGWETADTIIEECDLESGGVYTAVGTYPHSEMVQMVVKLSEISGISIPDLLKTYGKHLFGRFSQNYSDFFKGVDSAFDFLLGIENYIHVEVRKLYPEAELPSFEYQRPSDSELIMLYRSERPFADFAEGLIMGCIEHFNEEITIKRKDIGENPGHEAQFHLVLNPDIKHQTEISNQVAAD